MDGDGAAGGLALRAAAGLAALLGAQWLDADFIMLRESAQKQSAQVADRLGEVGARAVTSLPRSPGPMSNWPRPTASDPSTRLWQVVYGYNLGLLVLQRKGDRTTLPAGRPSRHAENVGGKDCAP